MVAVHTLVTVTLLPVACLTQTPTTSPITLRTATGVLKGNIEFDGHKPSKGFLRRNIGTYLLGFHNCCSRACVQLLSQLLAKLRLAPSDCLGCLLVSQCEHTCTVLVDQWHSALLIARASLC